MQTKTLTKIAKRKEQDSISVPTRCPTKTKSEKKNKTTSQDSRNGAAGKSETGSINTSGEWQPSQEPRGTPDKKKASAFTSNRSGSATAPFPC